MGVKSSRELKDIFKNGSIPTENDFADLIDTAGGYETIAEMLSGKSVFREGEIVAAEGFRYKVAPVAAKDHHLETKGGAKLHFQRSGHLVPAEAFGARGDGSTDDIAALERWRDYVEANNLIGAFDGKTYAVSRTLYLTAKASYVGCDGTTIVATKDFAADFSVPKDGTLAAGLAPVIFYDGRIEAIGYPNRRTGLSGIKIDASDAAAHGIIAAGVAAGHLDKIYVDNATVASFVICGIQNATVADLKGMAGASGALPSEAALWILNGAKNSVFESCDMGCARAETPALIRIGTNSNYPGPGNSKSLIAESPSQITFVKGVFETQGNSEEPLRMIFIEAGDRIRFIDSNMAAPATQAMIEASKGVTGVYLDGGITNGLGGAAPFAITEARDFVINSHVIQNLKGDGALIENNGAGRVYFTPADNGLFGSFSAIFGGSAAHHQNRFLPSRYYGNAATKTKERADQVTGTRWWDVERNLETVWINGAAVTPDGMLLSEGAADSKNWPTLTETDIKSGTLDLKGYSKVTLKLSSPTRITSMTAMQSGQMVTIVLDDGNATFASNVGLKLTDRAPEVNPQARDTISFARVNGSNLSGGSSEWVQTGGPVGLSTAKTDNLCSASHAINANGKRAGKFCLNLTDRKMYVALGPGARDQWYAFDGSATITPA